MSLRFDQKTSQNSTAQIVADTGKANRAPRAKDDLHLLRSRPDRELSKLDIPGLMIALSIVVSDILLLAEKLHKGMTRFVAGREQQAAHLISASAKPQSTARHISTKTKRARKRAVWLRRFSHELEDLAFVICLAFLPRRRGAPSMYRAISMRAKVRNRRHRGLALRAAAFICMSLMSPRLVLAEAPDVVTPIEMFDPDSGEGVRVAPAFVLYPQAVVDLTYDTNIYNVDTQEMEDAVVSFRPAFALRSDFSRHAVSLEGSADIRRYFDISDENSEQYRVLARTLLELGSGIDAEAFVGYNRGIERRGTAGDLFFTDKPVAYHEKRAGFELSRTNRQLELALGGGITKRDYSDTQSGGIPVDLSLRDVTLRTAKLRADLGMDARTKIFGEIAGNQIDYELPTAPSRDSSGYSALIGVKHELTSLVDIEAGIGFIHQDFKDPSVSSANEVNYRLAASWTPSPQWRLTASASRYVDASRSQESPAIITTEFKASAQHAVSDRLLVGAEAGYLEEDYRGLPRQDKRAFVAGSATYRLTDRIGVFASAGYRDQDGGEFGRSYSGFTGSIGLRAAW